jgi:rhomboid protease GluP
MLLFYHGASMGDELVRYGAVEGWRISEGEWWRVWTALFLHTNFFSYIIGCFFLYILGPQLEWLLGRTFFLMIYLLTGAVTFWFIYITSMEGVYYGSLGSTYGTFGIYLYLYLRKAIHPQFGIAIVIITCLNLLFDYPLSGVYFMSVITGFFLSMVLLHFRRPDKE